METSIAGVDVTSEPGGAAAGTATTAGARAHARAQHGRGAPFTRYVPPHEAPQVPGVEGPLPSEFTWAETVAPGGYTTAVLARGTRLRLTDPAGDACAHLLLYRADAPWERLNVADTVKVPWQAYPSTGHPLLSGFGRVLATVVADTAEGHHDALTGTSTAAGNDARYGASAPESDSPAGRELFTLGALKHGLTVRDIPPSVSFFQGVRVNAAGRFDFLGSAGPGRSVELLTHLDTVVLLANTAHPLDPRPEFSCSPLEVRAWRAEEQLAALTAGELVGPLGPEHRQAVANTEADLLARGTR
ncbi:urea carboxylase-associated family protein [Streptomyces triticirhizae]|uniref:Urea carboxylase-associated family protein n=1 Tax=Streptomyces triticirhizae TaxID=2483353 RepID=A0A3M2LMB8_9ACTN|nr:urea carboxylase-associated family protein [Streptomyces triticirhizae]